ncbi:N-acetyl-gamma-glutamyl-phosphate reductase [Methanosphaera cuniculi]|uniref:N-acetyl-gamma-glutamyl-phosphate reductase n=1 Tax=Methanosphaera cuniculi TaxID=1077256 RepID=A0A2A2HCG4_9EURY|nr:N-acetyl-gamma-glutamyl-phosphate reductase [Methanosphaera cuniculi]PAV06944.1 N-acetyl-gamma-glutamyl-phosphate reductase [Methanosphaera cuniculi]PWL08715.1 N-acetyl-gamma-glutamyl-phosphate reductase [Methanosphaera cuniculi]
MSKIDVAIIGASGYTGGELMRLLINHPNVNIKYVTSRKNKGEDVSNLHPNLEDVDLKFSNPNPEDIDADVVFSALPHGASMKLVPQYLENGSRVIDLSGDFRFSNIEDYEKWYNIKHIHPEIEAVFGSPEINREKIRDATLIANPGCFVTGAILSSLPIVENELVDRIILDSKSGVSGAGVNPTASSHYPTCADNIKPYSITNHRHTPEIREQLRNFGSGNVKVSFTPHLVPVIRGILTTNHSFLLKDDVSVDDIYNLYAEYYKDEPFVQVLKDNKIPLLASVRGSNNCQIGGISLDDEDQLVVISAIDNLVKGASGQAIQNMNIMFNFDETAGLKNVGLYP